LIGYGNLLIIKHDDLHLSAYANNAALQVNEGQKVTQGQVIARCGKSASGVPSLHFEIRKNGKSVNPLLYLPTP
jgi:lipoprotein NlpD